MTDPTPAETQMDLIVAIGPGLLRSGDTIQIGGDMLAAILTLLDPRCPISDEAWAHPVIARIAGRIRPRLVDPPATEYASADVDLAAHEPATAPETPDPDPSEGTAPTSPQEPTQAAVDTIARILVGTDWDDGVPYTDIGTREYVEILAGQIVDAVQPHLAAGGTAACVDGWTIYTLPDGLMVSHDTDADRPTLLTDDAGTPVGAVLAFIADQGEESDAS